MHYSLLQFQSWVHPYQASTMLTKSLQVCNINIRFYRKQFQLNWSQPIMLLLSILFSSWFFSQPNWQVFSNISIIILVLSLNKIKKFKSPFFTQLCNVLKNVVKTSKFYPPWKHQKPKVFCCFRGESNLEAFIIFFEALQCDMKKMGPRFPSYNVTLSKFKDTCMTNRSQMFWRITMLLNILQNST